MPIPLGSGSRASVRSRTCVPAEQFARRTLIRKTSLSSDRSDGVRSSSRHKTSSAPCALRRLLRTMLGDCVPTATQSLRTFVTIGSRSDPTSSRCQISRIRIDRRQSYAEWHVDGSGMIFSANEQVPAGGARRDRTDDLLLAKQALSQLSYGPGSASVSIAQLARSDTPDANKMVGLGRLELPTSRLSSARSNQLSYKPEL